MEKYFIVNEKSRLYKEYFNYVNNQKAMHEHAKRFMDEHGIKAEYYAYGGNYFYIEPTKEDIEKFGGMLCKTSIDGLRRFKKNSAIGKAWVQSLKDVNLQPVQKPWISLYVDCVGQIRARLFHRGPTLYGSLKCKAKFELPPDFEEIKASEFYRALAEKTSANGQ